MRKIKYKLYSLDDELIATTDRKHDLVELGANKFPHKKYFIETVLNDDMLIRREIYFEGKIKEN